MLSFLTPSSHFIYSIVLIFTPIYFHLKTYQTRCVQFFFLNETLTSGFVLMKSDVKIGSLCKNTYGYSMLIFLLAISLHKINTFTLFAHIAV